MDIKCLNLILTFFIEHLHLVIWWWNSCSFQLELHLVNISCKDVLQWKLFPKARLNFRRSRPHNGRPIFRPIYCWKVWAYLVVQCSALDQKLLEPQKARTSLTIGLVLAIGLGSIITPMTGLAALAYFNGCDPVQSRQLEKMIK